MYDFRLQFVLNPGYEDKENEWFLFTSCSTEFYPLEME